ncbi:MAG: DNA primase [Verrucomicrobiaceae bacterium]|nr:DNA primase [Verrucomicrobiaceae bacterium]
MPRIKQSTIDEIRHRIPIEQVIGDYVALKKSGSTLKGLSPFSQEKTPSFVVNSEKGFYHCFSTSQGGDMFTFVQKLENLNFAESVEFIAKKFGIQVEYDYVGNEAQNSSLNKQILDMHEDAATWFSQQFFADNEQAQAIRKYWVEQRKMTLDDAKELRIGYAPVNSFELKKIFSAKKYDMRAILSSSIFVGREGERNMANVYPKFRGRMVIPICDIQGRVIGFTGRKTEFTPDNQAESGKYVNSRETDVFKKGNIAFNIHKAKSSMKEKDYCVIVEGQLDAIKMYTAGIKNTIATQGTALTDNHLMQIKRFCNRTVLLFDGDAAGIRANMKAISLCLKHELEPFIVPLPQGEDPDSFICKYGAEAMRQLVENKKKTAVSFAAQTLSGQAVEITAQKKGEIIFDIFEMLSQCKSKIILNEYLREVSLNFATSYVSVAKDFENFIEQKEKQKNPSSEEKNAQNKEKTTEKAEYKISSAQSDALIIALHCPDVGNLMAQAVDDEWIDMGKLSGKILMRLFGMFREGIEFDISEINNHFDSEAEKNAIYKILANDKIFIENPVKSANNCIKTIYKNHVLGEIEKANRMLVNENIEDTDKFFLLKRIADLKKKSQVPPKQIEEAD